jgi:hypothetical protein
MIRADRGRVWLRHRHGAVAARTGAVVLPLVAALVTASIGVFALETPGGGWNIPWWIGVVLCSCLVALAWEPLSRRLWTLAILLELEAQFPSEAPLRAVVALHASRATALQRRLVDMARAGASDDLVTARMATASALGALRVQRLRDVHRARLTSTVVLAACAAFLAVLVSPGTTPESTQEAARPPAPTAPLPTGTTPTNPVVPGSSSPSATPIPSDAPVPVTNPTTRVPAETPIPSNAPVPATNPTTQVPAETPIAASTGPEPVVSPVPVLIISSSTDALTPVAAPATGAAPPVGVNTAGGSPTPPSATPVGLVGRPGSVVSADAGGGARPTPTVIPRGLAQPTTSPPPLELAPIAGPPLPAAGREGTGGGEHRSSCDEEPQQPALAPVPERLLSRPAGDSPQGSAQQGDR